MKIKKLKYHNLVTGIKTTYTQFFRKKFKTYTTNPLRFTEDPKHDSLLRKLHETIEKTFEQGKKNRHYT